MSAATVAVRCPSCGQDLQAVLSAPPPTQWFPCPRCQTPLPVVRPRDPPPLYSWEVYPGLYPPLPRPRTPRWRAQRAAVVGLLAIVVLAAAFAGILGYYAYAATAPGAYAVNGTVYAEGSSGAYTPAAGAQVTITEDNGAQATTSTDGAGNFAFTGIPSGGIALHVALAGYESATLGTFASPVYNAGTTGIGIVLATAGTGNSTNGTLTPFPDLESFLASIGSGIVLLGVVAAIAVVAALLTMRSDRPALGVVGGGAGLAAPFTLYLLGLSSAFPILVATTAVLAGFGAFTLAVRAAELWQTAPAPGEY